MLDQNPQCKFSLNKSKQSVKNENSWNKEKIYNSKFSNNTENVQFAENNNLKVKL